jgi:hypothetical protein
MHFSFGGPKYTSENTEGQSKIDNPEKLAAKVTQNKENQNKNATQYVLDTTMHKQTQKKRE